MYYELHKQYVFGVIQQLKVDAMNTCSVCADTTNGRHASAAAAAAAAATTNVANRSLSPFFSRRAVYVWSSERDC